MGIAAALDVIAFLAQLTALKISPVSLIGPISSFNPVFTTIFAFFWLGETPTPLKLFGILLVVIGAYLLNVSDAKGGVFAPFKKLATQRGIQLAFLATFIWAITPIFQKKAIFETTPTIPLFASFTGIVFATLLLIPLIKIKKVQYKNAAKKHFFSFIFFGVFTALAQLAAYTAFSQAYVGYVTAILRLSGLFSVILGGWFLKETNIYERLLGAAVMLSGVLFIAL